jgi:peptide/nickel transport system substrate-binding protein
MVTRAWKMAGIAVVAIATLTLAALVALPASAQDAEEAATTDGQSAESSVLRIGWAQDPQTLNPFVALDEENYNVWALNWDLLVNFSPEDLSPAPGIAERWEVSEDRRTVTFELPADRKWSDGEPITSEDVKFSLETLGEEGDLFAGYTSNITSIEAPDDRTVVIETKQPDARIVGGLFIYMLPEHVWGETPVRELTGSFQPELPLVGSGPYMVTEFERGRIIRMERNPEWQGSEPAFDEIQYIKYGNQDGVERALRLGEIDMVVEVDASTFERLDEDPNIEALSSPSPSYTQLAFNLCPEELCPDAEVNRAIQDVEVRRAIAHAVDRDRVNTISARGTAFPGSGILPSFYDAFYEEPEQNYPFDPELANQILDEAGWEQEGDGPRTRDGEELSFELAVRSESPSNIQAARLVAEMAAEVGIEFNVDVVSVDKLTEITVRSVDGEPAPDFDTFIWGWGGDPYDPSFLLSLLTTDEIGGLSDGFYSNPEYDALYEQQAGSFDTDERKELIQQMVALTQDDVAYLVLTEDPNLQAYRTDRISGIEPTCPREDGDLICEQVSYEPLLAIEPADGSSADGDGDNGGSGGVVIAIIAAIVVIAAGLLLLRSRRRRASEPLEMEE